MKAAIYSRKSVLTGKGESMENQIQLCKEYSRNLNVSEFFIYEDEGFSGGNLDRPQFQKLLQDAKKKKFDVLICYRLDRVSRNISDFSTLIEDLSKLGIGFISIREQFDTSSPMGRAMMYIASVFAQLERETIAERVKDNMMELSKTGRWLGGPTPFGFDVIRVIEGEKEVSYLQPNSSIDKVKLVVNKYIELGSISKVQRYFFEAYSERLPAATVKQYLSAPYYVKSSPDVINYCKSLGITVIGEPNGCGIMPYNRRPNGTSRRTTPSSEWLYAVSKHDGVIEPEIWLQAQHLLSKNKGGPRAAKSVYSFLTGYLKCGQCGGPMTINFNHTRKDGTRRYYYVCENKRNYGLTYCNNRSAKAEELDANVVEYLENLSVNQELLQQELAATREKKDYKKELDKIKKAITKNEQAIQNLVKQLSVVSAEASTFIVTELDSMSKENTTLRAQQTNLESLQLQSEVSDINKGIINSTIKNFKHAFSMCKTIEEKRQLISSVVEKITWFGDTSKVKVKILQ